MLENINYRTVINSLDVNSQLQIWSWIIGSNISVGRTFCNPLRIDNHPGCFLREYSGILFLTDYKFKKLYSGVTCIHAIKELMNCTLQQASINVYAAIYFNKPLHFGLSTKVGTIQKGRKSSTKIDFNPYTYNKKAIWTKKSYEYWKVANVKLTDLEQMNVFDVKTFYMNDSLVVPKDLCIAYYFPSSGHVKLYQPYMPKTEKFIGTANKEDVWKANLGHSKRIITKSAKDVLTLKNLLPTWTIWAMQSEGAVCSELEEFDKTIIIYDADEAGYRTSKELQLLIPNSECVYFENYGKDAYEIASRFGIDVLKKEIKTLL